MGKTCDWNSAGARVHWRGLGIGKGDSRERQRGYDVGADAGGGGLLGCDLSVVAETNVGLCIWPRTDPRRVDHCVRRASDKVQGRIGWRACRCDEKQFPDRVGALLFSILCRGSGCRIWNRPLDMELGTLPGVVPFVPWCCVCLSCDIDHAHFANAPDGYHAARLFLLGSDCVSGKHQRIIARDSVIGGESELLDIDALVVGMHG